MSIHPVQFVSLGPGDPELITLKGFRALQAADCIFCPSTLRSDGRPLSRSAHILRQLGIAESQIVPFHLPMSKQRQAAQQAYDEVYRQATLRQQQGARVCIVAEGDAGLYSSIHYILERLQANQLPVEQMAGIPAFIASGARGALHLASQEERLTIVPGNATRQELEELTAHPHTVVIMKLPQCAEVVRQFVAAHPTLAYHYFENTGMPEECYLTSPTAIAARPFPYFSLLIIKRIADI